MRGRQVWAPAVLVASIAAYIGLHLAATWGEYRYFLYRDFDLAAWNQVFWNTLHGRFFYLSLRDIVWVHHAPLIALPLLPLYALWSSPLLLLTVLTAAIGFGAFPVFRLASRELGPAWGLAWAGLYLINPSVSGVNLAEFSTDGLSIPLWLAALAAVEANRFGWFIGFLSAALGCKELFGIPVVMTGVWLWLRRKPRRWWLAPILLGGGWLLATATLIPAVVGTSLSYTVFFPDWPRIADAGLKVRYLAALLLPLGGLSLAAPAGLMPIAPMLALHLASSFRGLYLPTEHYVAPLIPFLLAASIAGMVALRRRRQGRVALLLFVLGVILSLWRYPLAAALGQLPSASRNPLNPVRDRLVAMVPPHAPCLATFGMLAKLSSREHLYSVHYVTQGIDNYTGRPVVMPVTPEYLILDTTDPLTFYSGLASREGPVRLRRLLREGAWGLEELAGPMMLWQRGKGDQIIPLEPLPAPPGGAVQHARFDGALELWGAWAASIESRIGPLVAVKLDWRRANVSPGAAYAVEMVAMDRWQSPVAGAMHDLGYQIWPSSEWPPGTSVRTHHRLVLIGPEAGAIAGLRLRLWNLGTYRPAEAALPSGGLAEDGWVRVAVQER